MVRIFLGSLILFSFSSFARPLTFGAEFTFYSDEGVTGWWDVKNRMLMHLRDGQPEGSKFDFGLTEFGAVKLISPNGWWFSIDEDQGQVAEVPTVPATVDYFRQYQSDMQDAIFASAANVGFFPALYLGGGHINIGVRELLADPLLLRNFIVDLLNHNELFWAFSTTTPTTRFPSISFTRERKGGSGMS